MIIKHIEVKTLKILEDMGIIQASDIDVFAIAEHLQVDVKPAQLGKDISGLFVIKEDKPYIRYNGSENDCRINFTIAHELGHFFLHKDIPLFIDKNERIMFRDAASTTGEIMKEREANAFAAALLMPKPFIESELQKLVIKNDVTADLADIFNVSTQAMSFRLSNLDYDFGMF